MKHYGYKVVRLSFIHPEQSVHYNPLKYVKTTQQIQQLSNSLVYADEGRAQDPYWYNTSLMLINSLIAYIKETVPESSKDHNFHNILEMLRMAGRGDSRRTALSMLMDELYKNNPNSWAVKQFKNVNQAPDKTFNTIISTSVAKFCSNRYRRAGRSVHTIADDCDILIYMGGNDSEAAHQIALLCNKTAQTVLHMPLRSSWIFRRGEKPFMCINIELDEYLESKKNHKSPEKTRDFEKAS